MSTRGSEKTGKVADARRAVEIAQRNVESARAELLVSDGDFYVKTRALNGALIDLARKEEQFDMAKKKSFTARDDKDIVGIFRSRRVRTA